MHPYSKKLASRATLGLLLLSALSTGCARPTTTEELVKYSPTRLAKLGVTYLKIHGRLVDAEGNGIRAVEVTVSTPRSRTHQITTFNGDFYTDTTFAEDEPIDFQFASRDIDWSQTVYSVPKGVDEITFKFTADKYGRISLRSLEF